MTPPREGGDMTDCTGRVACPATIHIHGCYDDYGSCNLPGAHHGGEDVNYVWVLWEIGEEGTDWIEGVFLTRQEAMDVHPGQWQVTSFEPESDIRWLPNEITGWCVVPYELGKVVEDGLPDNYQSATN